MIKSIMFIVFSLSNFAKSPFSSLVIPGSYQIKKDIKRGYVYLAMEGILLSSYFYVHKMMGEMKVSYVEFAKENATGVVIRDESILALVEKYRSFSDYYEMLYREARQIYPDDPAKQDEYVKENLETTLNWQWESQSAWYTFQDKRRFYRELSNRTVILMGFILTNHLAALVDGVITHRLFKNRVKLNSSIYPSGAKIALNVSF